MSTYQKPDIKTDFSNMPVWLWVIIALGLYLFGGYAFFDVILDPANQEIFTAIGQTLAILIPLSLPFLPLFLLFGVLFLIVTFILAYVIVWIMSKLAQEVTIAVSILFPIVLIAVGGLLATAGAASSDSETAGLLFVGIFIAGFGVLLLAFVIWKFTVIKRSGQFVEFSAQLVLAEKAVLAMPVLLGLYSIVTGFFMLFGFIKIVTLFSVYNPATDAVEWSAPGILAAIIFEYVYLIVYLGIYYSLSAAVISYASDWYRGLDPDLNSAMKDVTQTLPVIIKFAFAMATVKIIISAVTQSGRQAMSSQRGQDNIGAAIGGFIFAAIGGFFISILGAIWMFLNYFTLVSIVQNKRHLTDSIKDSAKTTWNSLLDVLVGESGFGLTTFIFMIINSILWVVTGFGLGWAVGQNIGYGIVVGVIFFILGSLPYSVVTMPMKVAFRTFIYSFAKDTVEGFKKPSRLPTELRGELNELRKREVKRRGMRDPSQYF
ncbi:MAG: hypothetical protein ACFFE8_13140 [Candidatus Heimdallarchaeota archaeon]